MNALQSFAVARKLGVSPAGLQILLLVIDGSPTNPTQLAIRSATSTANVTGLLDRLETGRWVTRQRSTEDRRVWHIEPTERAVEVFGKVFQAK